MTDTNVKKALELVSNMSVMEVVELVKAMEEKFGVSAAAPVAVAAGPACRLVLQPLLKKKLNSMSL